MDEGVVLRDYFGRFICIVQDGNVYDAGHRRIGFIDGRGTFDDRGAQVSHIASPALLAGLALGRRLRQQLIDPPVRKSECPR